MDLERNFSDLGLDLRRDLGVHLGHLAHEFFDDLDVGFLRRTTTPRLLYL